MFTLSAINSSDFGQEVNRNRAEKSNIIFFAFILKRLKVANIHKV